MKILDIKNKNYLVDDDLLDLFIDKSNEKYHYEIDLLNELNIYTVGIGYEIEYKAKKTFYIDDYMPNYCVLHLTNDLQDNIYLYDDGSIEIGKSYETNGSTVTQLSYYQIKSIYEYAIRKGYIKEMEKTNE